MSLADYLEISFLARRYGAHAGDIWQLEHLARQHGVDRVREWLNAGVPEPLPVAASHVGRFDVLDVLLGACVTPERFAAISEQAPPRPAGCCSSRRCRRGPVGLPSLLEGRLLAAYRPGSPALTAWRWDE